MPILIQNSPNAGDTAQGLAEGTQYWAFRGRRVVAALADQLLAEQGLGNATDVLVAGDSAGGVSALNNADFMLQRAQASLPRWGNNLDVSVIFPQSAACLRSTTPIHAATLQEPNAQVGFDIA